MGIHGKEAIGLTSHGRCDKSGSPSTSQTLNLHRALQFSNLYRKSLTLRINLKISARKGGYPLFHIVNCISHGHTPFSISVPNPHSGSSSRCDDLISNITLYKRIRIGYHELNILQFQAGEQTSYIVMLIPIFSLSLVIYNNCQS